MVRGVMQLPDAETRATKIPEQQKCNNVHSIVPHLHPNFRTRHDSREYLLCHQTSGSGGEDLVRHVR